MLGKLLKYDLKANYLYLVVGYVVYIVLTLGFTLSLSWIRNSGSTGAAEEMIQMFVMIATTFLWVFSIMGVVLMTYILLIRRFYCNLVTDQGYLTLTLPVSARMHMLSKLISAVIFIGATACVLMAGMMVMAVGAGQGDVIPEILAAFGRLWEELGAGFTVVACISTVLSLLQAILLVYFSICIGQLCTKHKVWGSIGAYLGISFAINMVTSMVGLVAGVMGNGGLLMLFTENIYSIVYAVFLAGQCVLYFFGGAWLLEKRTNLE